LRNLPGLKVGIAWQGNPQHPDEGRFMPLTTFAPLAAVQGVRLISLQKGAGREQLRTVPFSVADLGSDLDEAAGAFMDTAAVMMNLDLVVTADTAVVHLAGGLGVPVWLAVPAVPNFRWLLDRADSPWYPTLRLFRQKTPGDWRAVFEEMREALHERNPR
jgi:hypothetical protein